MHYQEEGFYTRTQAFNFLKELLGISKHALINKDFFFIFFKESYGLFRIKKTEEEVKAIFLKNQISALNQRYRQEKEKKSGEAKSISDEIFAKARRGMSPEENQERLSKPYFVR
jgi:hypothetical protein